jgi:formylglycine-generating enzyme required for sulfatase activity
MGSNISAHASVFEKVLAAYETGGITYSDVLSQLRRLLATDAPPEELLEILRRRELIEPLPDSARAQVMALLNEAMRPAEPSEAVARVPAPPPMHAPPTTAEVTTLVAVPHAPNAETMRETARAASLATELAGALATLESEKTRLRELEQTFAESITANEAGRVRAEETLRKVQRYEGELGIVRESLAGRDAVVLQLQEALGERKTRIAALIQERDSLAANIEAGRTARARLEAELNEARAQRSARDAELAAVQSALAAEQTRGREAGKASAATTTAADQSRALAEKMQQQLEHIQNELRNLRAAHTALQQEHASALSNLAARSEEAKRSASELATTRAQLETTQQKLLASEALTGSLKGQIEEKVRQLVAAKAAADAATGQAKSYLESLQTREWRGGDAQNRLRDLDAQVTAGRAERAALIAERDRLQTQLSEFQTQPAGREAIPKETQAPVVQQLENPYAAPAAKPFLRAPGKRTDRELPADSSPSRLAQAGIRSIAALRGAGRSTMLHITRARRDGWRSGEGRRALGLTAVIGGVALVVWALFHMASAPSHASLNLATTAPDPGTTLRDCPTCPSITVLPPGRFKQGSAHGDASSGLSEKPLHWVLIARHLGMTTSPVTVEEFKQFATATGRDMQGCDIYDGDWHHAPTNNWTSPGFEQTPVHPVTCVSWDDADAYAKWLSAATGHRYRLPSASEWEYAARAGGDASQPWGGDGADACANANVADKAAGRRYPGWTTFACDDGFVNTSPVDTFKANAFGLSDMLGNVFQWTADCWHADYRGAPIDGSPRLDGDCSEHELRGGSWFSSPSYVRSNYRNHFASDYRASSVGIRLVRELD